MDILPPSGNPWRNPHEDRSLTTARQDQHGDYEVIVHPGADVADLVGALGTIPTTAIFTESYGDVETVLVFRPIPGASVPATVPPAIPPGGGPDDRTATRRALPAGPGGRLGSILPFHRPDATSREVFVGVGLGRFDEHEVRRSGTGGDDGATVVSLVGFLCRDERAESAAYPVS